MWEEHPQVWPDWPACYTLSPRGAVVKRYDMGQGLNGIADTRQTSFGLCTAASEKSAKRLATSSRSGLACLSIAPQVFHLMAVFEIECDAKRRALLL
jgi:hypothetical protein